jgi:hypothetical protein
MKTIDPATGFDTVNRLFDTGDRSFMVATGWGD